MDRNLSGISVEEPPSKQLVEGSELIIERLHLNFVAKLGNVEKQSIKITNVGSSAIYVEWVFLNTSKINPSALKDSKSKFFSHY